MWVTIEGDAYTLTTLVLWIPWEFIMCVHCIKQKLEITTAIVQSKLSVSIYVYFCKQKRGVHMQVCCSVSLKKISRHLLENISSSTRGCTCFLWTFCQGYKWQKSLQAWDRTNGWYSAYNKERKVFALPSLKQTNKQKSTLKIPEKQQQQSKTQKSNNNNKTPNLTFGTKILLHDWFNDRKKTVFTLLEQWLLCK